ncbi:MAG: discoidin domain-containing protein [Lentisphaerota bacterium]
MIPVVNDGSWVVTASTAEGGQDAGKAVDRDAVTRWSSEFSDPQWWMVDFGREQVIGRIRILWEKACSAEYKIFLSNDGKDWSEVFHEVNGSGGESLISFPARPARFVKIESIRRATQWGVSFFEVEFNPSIITVQEASASSGNGDYAPGFAVDGKMGTRWCSDFTDSAWWQARFDEPTILAGLRISWETAFSEKYEIAVSMDGELWQTVYKVEEGDGQTDIIMFKPVEARFLRIVCNQRGTGWGNSIWEVKFFGKDQAPKVSASSTAAGTSADLVLDGDPATAWRSEGDGLQTLEIALPETMNLGGVELLWGTDFATEYSVEYLRGDGQWAAVADEKNGNGAWDYIFFPAVDTSRLRIICHKSNKGQGYALAHMELKSGEEQVTPIKDYQSKAKNDRRGMFPMWLTREQEFWTVVGIPDDDQESLLSETGILEPFKGAFSVQPFVTQSGKVIGWNDVKQEQSLEQDELPLPTVRWLAEGWVLEISALAFGEPGKSSTAVRYRMINTSATEFQGKLALAVRPVQLNPLWQHGGMSPIRSAEWQSSPPRLLVDGRVSLLFPTPPTAAGVAALSDGDPVDFFSKGECPSGQKAADPDGKTGAGMLFDLTVPAGESRDVVVVFPLHSDLSAEDLMANKPADAFAQEYARQIKLWEKQLNRVMISIPETRLIKILKSNLAYVLINRDDPWFKPGSRNYNHAWMRDGALTGVAVMRMGHPELPGRFIKAFSGFISENGWVPFMVLEDSKPISSSDNPVSGEGQEYDSQGEYAFIVRQYVDYTGDTNLLAQVYPTVVKVLQFAKQLRRRRMTEEYKTDPAKKAYFGILPESNSHEGYYPAKHSYWDDFWLIRGLKDGIALAERMGRQEDAAWMKAELEDTRKDLYASMLEVIRQHGMTVLPGCVELGDIDPTSTTMGIMVADESDELPQPYGLNTFDLYFTNFSKRLNGVADTFTPYEARNADVFVRLGQRERALAMFRYFERESVRPHNWNHMAEVVHAKMRAPSYIGDMPHTWVGSDLINAMRSMFVYEHGQELVLAGGIDPAWVKEGVSVSKMPTQYGLVSYAIREADGVITCHFEGTAHPSEGFVLPVPTEWSSFSAVVNGQPADTTTGAVRFQELPCDVILSR